MHHDRIKRLLAEIFADSEQVADAVLEAPPCHSNQEEIVAYIEAEQDGLNASVQFPEIHAQIHSCRSCYRVYEELQELLEMARAETLVEPPLAADFVLPVQDEVASDGHVIVERAGASQTSGQSVQQRDTHSVLWTFNEIGQMIAAFSIDLLQSFQPSPQLNYLKAPMRELFSLQSPEIAADLNITIAAHTKRRDPEQCTLTVTADIPSRGGWPNLGGTAITLLLDAEKVATEVTDAFGTVIFDGIACTALAQAQVLVQPEK